MAKRRKSLGVAVAQYHSQRHRREVKTNAVYKIRSGNESQRANQGKREGGGRRNDAGGHFPVLCAGVKRVEPAVYVAVKTHGGAAREHHAKYHLSEKRQVEVRHLLISQHKAYQREGQRENSMAEFDKRKVLAGSFDQGFLKIKIMMIR